MGSIGLEMIMIDTYFDDDSTAECVWRSYFKVKYDYRLGRILLFDYEIVSSKIPSISHAR